MESTLEKVTSDPASDAKASPHLPQKGLPPLIESPEGERLPPMGIQEIMTALPHRAPFLMIDAVTEHIKGKYIRGYKNVTINEPFFQGHFPDRPIMPGVLQIEALAQIGAVIVSQMPQGKNKLGVLAGVDNVRFRRMVVPGDRLDLEAVIHRFRYPVGKAVCRASVNGEIAVEAEVTFSLVDP